METIFDAFKIIFLIFLMEVSLVIWYAIMAAKKKDLDWLHYWLRDRELRKRKEDNFPKARLISK